jgi:hypothetical protein
VVGSALPTEHGFTVAFALAGGACAMAALASLLVPQAGREQPAPAAALSNQMS